MYRQYIFKPDSRLPCPKPPSHCRQLAVCAGLHDTFTGHALTFRRELGSPFPLHFRAMKLTTFTDYSLRVLIYLAADPTRRATIAEIAASFGVSENHLVKVIHFLGRQGWIDTVRGEGYVFVPR